MNGLISRIERGSTLDGPGIRTVVFLKGCPLSCPWCHNPETMMPAPQPVWESRLCIACGRCVAACPAGALTLGGEGMRIAVEACRTCDLRCVEACLNGALGVCGEHMSTETAWAVIRRDADFYRESGGGVTFSGGEPLAQADFVAELARRCRQHGVHTAVDTSCHAGWPVFSKVLPWTDLLLCDLKLFESRQHKELTGVPPEGIHENLRRADAAGCRIWIRRPVVPGINDSAEDMEATAAFAATLQHLERIELLPFNALAGLKYGRIGRPFSMAGKPAPSPESMEKLKGILRARGLPCPA